jgi:hypothetical protein
MEWRKPRSLVSPELSSFDSRSIKRTDLLLGTFNKQSWGGFEAAGITSSHLNPAPDF